MNTRSGFTLFEVLTVIAIIGIISCISPVSSGFYRHSNFETTINKIVMDLRRFRMKAVYNNKTYYFRIYRDDDIFRNDADRKSDYVFYYENNEGEEQIVYHGEYPGKYTLYKNLNEVVINDDCYDRISFTGRGTACTGTIGLENTDGKLLKIVVSQLGRVRIER